MYRIGRSETHLNPSDTQPYSLFASGPLAIVGGALADLYPSAPRGIAMVRLEIPNEPTRLLSLFTSFIVFQGSLRGIGIWRSTAGSDRRWLRYQKPFGLEVDGVAVSEFLVRAISQTERHLRSVRSVQHGDHGNLHVHHLRLFPERILRPSSASAESEED